MIGLLPEEFTTQDALDAWGHGTAPTKRGMVKLILMTGMAVRCDGDPHRWTKAGME